VAADGTLTWRELLAETAGRTGSADEARWLCQEASGLEGTEWLDGLDAPATQRAVARLDAMVARRETGEPLQYVLGHWPFRRLDLLVDRRVLIPRPETEQLVDVALALGRELAPPVVVADLGTGSGAIGLALATELRGDDRLVWLVDVSEEAVEVARANLAGIGRAAVHVMVGTGSWFAALPGELRGALGLVVSNPPYVAESDPALEPAVGDWEPAGALFAGPDGLAAIGHVVQGAAEWLRPGGALVCEIGTAQGAAASSRAEAAGLIDVRVERDLAGHERFLVARRA
jgi:release factor glutamine methyltransferase